MYAKIFTQIFDSSIAENYEVRHVFEDLLKLADKTGAVDMTVEAVARRVNAPLEKVKSGIEALMQPDPKSRSHEHEGRRLIPLDSGRDWGWLIVNYERYRAIQDEETRRACWRDAKAKQRAKKRNGNIFSRGESDGRRGRYVKAHGDGDEKACGEIAAEGL